MTEKIKPLTQIQKKYLKERVDSILESFDKEIDRARRDIEPKKIGQDNTLFKALKSGDLSWIHDTNIVDMIKTKVNRAEFSTYYEDRVGTVELYLRELIVGAEEFVEKRKSIKKEQERVMLDLQHEFRLKASTLTDKAILEGTDISEQVELFRIECNDAVKQYTETWKHVDTWEKEGNEVNMAEASEMVA